MSTFPKVTLRQINEVKHAAFKERDFYLASLALARFYRVEVKHMEENGLEDMGCLPDGTPKSTAWFKANIRHCETEAKDYQASYQRLTRQLAEMRVMHKAKQWSKELP